MFDPLVAYPSTDWVRLLLIYLHLLFCAGALALVLSADWRIVAGTFTLSGLHYTARCTAFVLMALWITGLALVYIDTGMAPGVLQTKPKLLLKLLTVLMLTANGVILHTFAFPLLVRKSDLSFRQSLVLAISGAFSTSHWLLAAFVGVARPLAKWPLQSLLAVYVMFCMATLVAALLSANFVRRRLLGRPRASPASAVEPESHAVDVLLVP